MMIVQNLLQKTMEYKIVMMISRMLNHQQLYVELLKMIFSLLLHQVLIDLPQLIDLFNIYHSCYKIIYQFIWVKVLMMITVSFLPHRTKVLIQHLQQVLPINGSSTPGVDTPFSFKSKQRHPWPQCTIYYPTPITIVNKTDYLNQEIIPAKSTSDPVRATVFSTTQVDAWVDECSYNVQTSPCFNCHQIKQFGGGRFLPQYNQEYY